MNRTHNNGQLRMSHVGDNVELIGWVAKKRNLGALVFIDLRDRYGVTQIIFDESFEERLKEVKNEYILQVKGSVIERSSKNPKMATGDIEVQAKDFQIINTAKLTPMIVADETDALEVTQILNNGSFEVLKNEVRTIYYNDTSFSLLAYNDEINPDQLKASDKSIKIGIAHQPDTFIQASNTVDLQISGHSCGGSIYIPYFGPLLPIDGAKTYNHGQYEKKGATLLVSNGISGPSSFPYKVFAKNEINFITLNSSSTR